MACWLRPGATFCYWTEVKAFCVQFFKNLLTVLVLGGFVQSLSHVRLFVTPCTVARQAPLSTGFSRQECWSGVPFPSPGDLPDPGIKPESPTLQAGSLPSDPPGGLNADKKQEAGIATFVFCSTWAFCHRSRSVARDQTYILLLFSHSVVFDSLRLHGLQHNYLPEFHRLPELAQTQVP